MKGPRVKQIRGTQKPACPVCASGHVAFKYPITRHGFDVWVCGACSSEFQHPLPKSADAYYDEGYYTGKSAFSYQDERRQEHYHNFVHSARVRSIAAYIRAGNTGEPHGHSRIANKTSVSQRPKFLDVGCAFGALVRAAAENFESTGLDVSDFAVSEGNKINSEKKLESRLWRGDLTHVPKTLAARRVFAADSFAAITLIEVAEHLQDPRAAFASAYKLLKRGGVLVIQTANFEGWQAVKGGADYHYYLPGHLVYYSATGLKKMLTDLGFCEFKEFFPVDFPLWAKWRKAWGEIKSFRDLTRFWRMSLYHLKSKLRWRGRPLTCSYVLYARK